MLDRFRQLPPRRLTLLCGVAVLAVAVIDWFTGPDIQALVLYLVPVVAAAWYAGPRTGTVFAVGTTAVAMAIAVLTPDGHTLAVAATNAVLRLSLLLLALRGVEAERRHVDAIRTSATVDPLTGALNRRAFGSAVSPRLSVRDAVPGTMLYLDVDGLKRLNDELGHEEGDRHLVALAGIIKGSIREGDHFARLGGDEFAVFLTGQDVHAAHAVAARLLARCADRDETPIQLSIGVAPGDTPQLGSLLRRADDAMYEAKRSGGGIRVERRSEPGTPTA